jgi:signal transduction histidine kinase
LFRAEEAQQVAQWFETCKNKGQGEFEARMTNAAGETRYMHWIMRWSQADTTFFCVAHDVTAQKQADQLRQEVAQMVSHDLRSPLTTVHTFFQMVETSMFGELSGDATSGVTRGLSATDKMLAVIKQFLEAERKRSAAEPSDL